MYMYQCVYVLKCIHQHTSLSLYVCIYRGIVFVEVQSTSRFLLSRGIIFGALAMTQNFAGAFFSSMTFLGLGLAGLETVNCEAPWGSVVGDRLCGFGGR